MSENDWIDWAGGECPVPWDTIVDTKMRSGAMVFGFPAKQHCLGYWQRHGDHRDIIAYRVVPA